MNPKFIRIADRLIAELGLDTIAMRRPGTNKIYVNSGDACVIRDAVRDKFSLAEIAELAGTIGTDTSGMHEAITGLHIDLSLASAETVMYAPAYAAMAIIITGRVKDPVPLTGSK